MKLSTNESTVKYEQSLDISLQKLCLSCVNIPAGVDVYPQHFGLCINRETSTHCSDASTFLEWEVEYSVDTAEMGSFTL